MSLRKAVLPTRLVWDYVFDAVSSELMALLRRGWKNPIHPSEIYIPNIAH
jgi:hypothetical protein